MCFFPPRIALFHAGLKLMTPQFTILLPITRPPIFLPHGIETVLAQTVAEFELFVICDGAPRETVVCAESFARRDPRVKVRAFAKDPLHGESLRDLVLREASGRFVAYLEDDDLWFPDHLEELGKTLESADFGHTIHVTVSPLGSVEALPSDLRIAEFRQLFLDDLFNRFGLTVCGHRMDAYRKLSEGWAPTPFGIWPDLHMWRKFFSVQEFRFDTRMKITAVTLPNWIRQNMTPEELTAESRSWLLRVSDPEKRATIVEAAWRSTVDKEIKQELDFQKTRAELRAAEFELAYLREAHLAEQHGHSIQTLIDTQSELARISTAYAVIQGTLAHWTKRWEAERIKMDLDMETLQRQHDCLVQSRSWRLTRPFRALGKVGRQLESFRRKYARKPAG
jgi:glycosyltransferase involved in cell wall biosynthesis